MRDAPFFPLPCLPARPAFLSFSIQGNSCWTGVPGSVGGERDGVRGSSILIMDWRAGTLLLALEVGGGPEIMSREGAGLPAARTAPLGVIDEVGRKDCSLI